MKLFNRIFKKDDKTTLPSFIIETQKRGKLIVLDGESLSPEKYVQDLINQIENDIFPILYKLDGGAPFLVCRNVLCFVDHISRLKYGNRPIGIRMSKVIKEFAYFDKFSFERYKKYAPIIVQTYRNELVHNIRPYPKPVTIIKNSLKTQEVSWFYIFGKHINGSFDDLARKFKTSSLRKDYAHLRYTGNQIAINTDCLLFDVVNYLKEYKEELAVDTSIRKRMIKNYYKILNENFKDLNFVIDKDSEPELTDTFNNLPNIKV